MNHQTGILIVVSIHTPIQGVTLCDGILLLWLLVSIHTPIQGVTFNRNNSSYTYEFQSTHPYRV